MNITIEQLCYDLETLLNIILVKLISKYNQDGFICQKKIYSIMVKKWFALDFNNITLIIVKDYMLVIIFSAASLIINLIIVIVIAK